MCEGCPTLIDLLVSPCTDGCCKSDSEDESIDLSYERRVQLLAVDLIFQFRDLDSSTALKRANEIIQSAEQTEAMYLNILEDDDQ